MKLENQYSEPVSDQDEVTILVNGDLVRDEVRKDDKQHDNS